MKKQSNAYLRFSLLKIWFIKNIKVFLLSALIIFAILIVTNVIDIAVLESVPGMGPIVTEFKTGMSNINQGGWITFIASISATITLVTKKAKGINLSDIASNEIKYLLIKAGLKFDINGHLCKASDSTDNAEKTETETYPQMLIRACREFKLIVCADINGAEDFNKVIEDADLEEAKKVADSYQGTEITVDICESDETGKPKGRLFGVIIKFGSFVKDGFLNIFKKIKLIFGGNPEDDLGWGDENVETIPPKNEPEIPEDDAVEIPEPDEDDDLGWGDGENIEDDTIVETPEEDTDDKVLNETPEDSGEETEKIPEEQPKPEQPKPEELKPRSVQRQRPQSAMDRLLAKKRH